MYQGRLPEEVVKRQRAQKGPGWMGSDVSQGFGEEVEIGEWVGS